MIQPTTCQSNFSQTTNDSVEPQAIELIKKKIKQKKIYDLLSPIPPKTTTTTTTSTTNINIFFCCSSIRAGLSCVTPTPLVQTGVGPATSTTFIPHLDFGARVHGRRRQTVDGNIWRFHVCILLIIDR